jgi:DNA replication protein DnaC
MQGGIAARGPAMTTATLTPEKRFMRLEQHVTPDERSEMLGLMYWSPRIPDSEHETRAAQLEQLLSGAESKYAAEVEAARVARRRREVCNAQFPITTADEEALAARALKQTRSRRVVETFLSGDKALLLLVGSTGVGKTIACCEAIMKHGGQHVSASHFARLFVAEWGDDVEEREALVNIDRLFVIDDIGTERNPDLMKIALVEAIDRRRTRGRRSIWISNLSRADFETRYPDPRLHSRLAQSALWSTDVSDDMRKSK